LTEADRERWQRSSPVARSQLEAGRALVRQLVEETGWAQWRGIRTDRLGRPWLRGAQDVDISISHSEGWILVAIGRGCRIGADVQKVTAVFQSRALVRRACTVLEARALSTLPQPERPGRLADLWTAKEAAVKADGRGLSIDLRGLTAPDAGVTRILRGASGWSACLVLEKGR